MRELINQFAKNMRAPEQRLRARTPDVGSARYDRQGRPWVFVKGQLYREPDRDIKLEQLVFENKDLGTRTFTPSYKDFNGDKEFDLIFVVPPAAVLAPGGQASVEMLALIVSVAYELVHGELPTWAWASARAEKLHAQFSIKEPHEPSQAKSS